LKSYNKIKGVGARRLDNAAMVLTLPHCLPLPVRSSLKQGFIKHLQRVSFNGFSSGAVNYESDAGHVTASVDLVHDHHAALLGALDGDLLDDDDDDLKHSANKDHYLLLVDIGAKLTQSTLFQGSNSEDFIDDQTGEWLSKEPLGGKWSVCGMDDVIDKVAHNLIDKFNLENSKVTHSCTLVQRKRMSQLQMKNAPKSEIIIFEFLRLSLLNSIFQIYIFTKCRVVRWRMI
jgi:hypothetical protein